MVSYLTIGDVDVVRERAAELWREQERPPIVETLGGDLVRFLETGDVDDTIRNLLDG